VADDVAAVTVGDGHTARIRVRKVASR